MQLEQACVPVAPVCVRGAARASHSARWRGLPPPPPTPADGPAMPRHRSAQGRPGASPLSLPCATAGLGLCAHPLWAPFPQPLPWTVGPALLRDGPPGGLCTQP